MRRLSHVEDDCLQHSTRTAHANRTKSLAIVHQMFQLEWHTLHIRASLARPIWDR